MDNLEIIHDRLNTQKNNCEVNYFMPEVWNYWGFEKYTKVVSREGEILVNPYEFLSDCIQERIFCHVNKDKDYLIPVGSADDNYCVNPARHSIYSMFPRMLTAWRHDEKGSLDAGTFLKAICLLPFLKELGIDIVYLLPIFKYSDRYKKGEVGSPYSIKNIYKIDNNLHDPLLGDYSEELLEIEFKAFVEACHLLGMQVMLDYAFRTVSRDSDLIIDHPDWFYWIDKKYMRTITAPSVEKIKKPIPMSDKALDYLYTSKDLKDYLAKFVRCPREVDPAKWEELVSKQSQTGENILDLIETEFGMTTLPGFSDVINDTQPPWTDVTYLRFYFDVHEKAQKYVDHNQPPYIMQDGVGLKLYPGKEENTELVEYISDVIPYYQKKFGIDGARIDMGHALTPALNREIVARARSSNRNFILWSEEFDPAKSGISRENGFHFINGSIWAIYKNLEKPSFNKQLIEKTLMKAELPVIATLETPDTPRAAWVHKDRKKLEQLIFLNTFLPNTVQFINNGFEVMETQPMNLGLDNSEEGRFVLNQEDQMCGKLAFFDNYCMHWLNSDREWMQKLLHKAAGLRKRYLEIVTRKDCFVAQPELIRNRKLIFLFYTDKTAYSSGEVKNNSAGEFSSKLADPSNKSVFFLANRNFKKGARFNLVDLLPDQECKGAKGVKIVYPESDECIWEINKNRLLKPGEVVVGEVIYEERP